MAASECLTARTGNGSVHPEDAAQTDTNAFVFEYDVQLDVKFKFDSTFVSEKQICQYNGTDQSIVIPHGVTSIADGVFCNKNLKEISIPDSVFYIGENAVRNNNLTKVKLPRGVIRIGRHAFRGNDIQHIQVTSTTWKIDIRPAFCYMKDVKLEAIILNNVTVIEREMVEDIMEEESEKYGSVFYTSVVFEEPCRVTTIEELTFAYSKITDIEIPSSVKKIEDCAFLDNMIAKIAFKKGATAIDIGDGVFYGQTSGDNGIKNIFIPKSMTDAMPRSVVKAMIGYLGTDSANVMFEYERDTNKLIDLTNRKVAFCMGMYSNYNSESHI